MSQPKVSYVDFEAYGGGRPSQLSMIIVNQPDGDNFVQPDPSDLPAAYLDALRTWLWGAPTGLALGNDGAPQAAIGLQLPEEYPPYDHDAPCCGADCEGISCWTCRGTGHPHNQSDPCKINESENT